MIWRRSMVVMHKAACTSRLIRGCAKQTSTDARLCNYSSPRTCEVGAQFNRLQSDATFVSRNPTIHEIQRFHNPCRMNPSFSEEAFDHPYITPISPPNNLVHW